jgi:hypothetical protein
MVRLSLIDYPLLYSYLNHTMRTIYNTKQYKNNVLGIWPGKLRDMVLDLDIKVLSIPI